jgi:LytS/YehU family sensor histidine kinase
VSQGLIVNHGVKPEQANAAGLRCAEAIFNAARNTGATATLLGFAVGGPAVGAILGGMGVVHGAMHARFHDPACSVSNAVYDTLSNPGN